MRRILLLLPFVLLACSGDDGTTFTPDAAIDDAGNVIGPDGQVIPKDASTIDSGPTLCGTVTCSGSEVCLNGAVCACKPGFVPQSTGGCIAAPSDSPASHTQTDVCQKWKDGHVVTTPQPFTKGAGQCDLGTFSQGGITDTLTRINMFRWFEMEAAVTDDPTKDAAGQACATIQANNNPASLTPSPHQPQAGATCYNALGATTSGQSNLAWGTSTADSIDLYMKEPGAGNATSLGHRRWVLNPPLGKVGIGYIATGSNTNGYGGQAQCLGVFDTSGAGPKPTWYAWPPAGYVPVAATQYVANQGWAWHFSIKQKNVIGNATVTVKNLTTNADAPVTLQKLGSGYGDDAIAFGPNGWTPAAGSVYRVTVDIGSSGKYVYDVLPVTCP
ncbi:hypothetical protein BH09MYX1_BH09MYX1_59740 [soil metagenome]